MTNSGPTCAALARARIPTTGWARRAGISLALALTALLSSASAALAADHFRLLAARARAALEHSDPWEGFSEFMRRAAEQQASDRALAEVMAVQPDVMREAAMNRADLHEAVAELVARAQAAGRLRADVVPEDVPMLMCGLGRATSAGAGGPAASCHRYLAIVLDGLRAPGATPLPGAGACDS